MVNQARYSTKMAPQYKANIKEKAKERGKKRKATEDNTPTSQNPKRTKASGGDKARSSSSQQPATGSQSHRSSAMSEEEATATPGENAIHISSSESGDAQPPKSDAESSEAELGREHLFEPKFQSG